MPIPSSRYIKTAAVWFTKTAAGAVYITTAAGALALLLLTAVMAGELRSDPPRQYEVLGKSYQVLPSSLGYLEIGIASWYGTKFHGRLTSLGETYDMHGMTAAHKSLPLPTVVRVTNLDNGKTATLRVNDRGPFHDDRLIDLSYAAAQTLGFQSRGTVPVVVEALDAINHPDITPPPDLVAESATDSRVAQAPEGDSKTALSGSSQTALSGSSQTALSGSSQTAMSGSSPLVYLQAGAFSLQAGAAQRLAEVQQALPEATPARILHSETDEQALYKVWVGPIWSEQEEQEITARLTTLGKTLRVKVH